MQRRQHARVPDGTHAIIHIKSVRESALAALSYSLSLQCRSLFIFQKLEHNFIQALSIRKAETVNFKMANSAARPVNSKEKAVHLIRVYMVILSIFALIGWLHLVIVRHLSVESKEMEHMDPSEIIAIPYSLHKLTSFVMFPVVVVMVLWLVRTPQKMMSNLLKLTKLVAVVYALFGMCGSHIVDDYQHSLTAALYVAALASTTWTDTTSSNMLEELPFYNFSNHVLGFCQLYGMLLVSIPFQILTVLDRGFQLQRWPLPVILGATYGYVFGSVIGIFFMYYERLAKEKQKR